MTEKPNGKSRRRKEFRVVITSKFWEKKKPGSMWVWGQTSLSKLKKEYHIAKEKLLPPKKRGKCLPDHAKSGGGHL